MGKSEKSRSQQDRAGIVFPVARIMKRMRATKATKKISPTSAVFVAGVVETLITRVLRDAAENAAQRVHGKTAGTDDETKTLPQRMNLVDVVAAIRQDPDVARTFADFSFSSGNDVPKARNHIFPADKLKENRARDRKNKENRILARDKKRDEKNAKKAAAAAAAAEK